MRTDSTSSRVSLRAGRAQGLDGLRALAALSVLVFHLWVYSEPVVPGASLTLGQQVWDSTQWGLFLFFVLSGYLLYRPWVRAALGEGERPALRRYLRLRAARIAPAYYLALLGAAVIAALGSAPPMRLPTHGTGALFLVFGENFSDHSLRMLDSPMWTLPIEVSFYIALPAIGIAGLRWARSSARQAVLMTGLVGIGVAWAHLASGLWLAGVVLPQMLPFFALGMAVAVGVEGRAISRRLCRRAVVAALLAYVSDLALNAWAPGVAGALEELPVALGFSLLVAVAAAGEWVPRLLRAKTVVWLGVVSYGVYLWHEPLMCLFGGHGLLPRDVWIELPIVVPATMLVAWVSWRWVEAPVLRRAHAGTKRRRDVFVPRDAGAGHVARPIPALASPR